MNQSRCNRCDAAITPPGYPIPMTAVPVLFFYGGIKNPRQRTGYCGSCAKFAQNIAILVFVVLAIAGLSLVAFDVRAFP